MVFKVMQNSCSNKDNEIDGEFTSKLMRTFSLESIKMHLWNEPTPIFFLYFLDCHINSTYEVNMSRIN